VKKQIGVLITICTNFVKVDLMCAGIIEQDTYKLKFFLIRDITILHYL